MVRSDPAPNSTEQTERTCVGCGASAPATQTSYTLISSSHGWRLHKRVDAVGRRILEWRCPDCWARFKHAHGGFPPPSSR